MTGPERPRSPWRIHPQDCACATCRTDPLHHDRVMTALGVVEALIICAVVWCVPLALLSAWWGFF